MKFLVVFAAVAISGSLALTLTKKSFRASCPPKPPTVAELDVTKVPEWTHLRTLLRGIYT
jgi:hypothetical protein